MSRTPTLEDVAAAAGVSTATVSRCLNSPDKVVPETRQRVMEAVSSLGYAPNFSARALVAKRTQTIGAVIPTMENAIFAEGVQAFQSVLQAEDFMLLIASSGYDRAAEFDAIRTLAARGADGVLLVGFDRSPEVYEFLATQSIPAIVAWAYDSERPVASVGFDNMLAMHALAAHAIKLGHSKVGIVSGQQSGNDRARDRVEGVQLALKDAGLRAAIVIEAPYGIAQGAAAFEKLLKEAPDTTLVLCGNDVLAAGAIRQALAQGLSVPDDVSITGFDDLAIAQLVEPQIATVRVPHRKMGEAAAAALLECVAGKSAESQLLPTELCLRASLAPPFNKG
ncbi:MAG: LacI family DNA-binding transcriptional regulator [Pseudomonadota bacterium]